MMDNKTKIELESIRTTNAQPGDIVQFDDGVIMLVLNKEGALLKYTSKDDWFSLAESYYRRLQSGDIGYKILARRGEWKIVRNE